MEPHQEPLKVPPQLTRDEIAEALEHSDHPLDLDLDPNFGENSQTRLLAIGLPIVLLVLSAIALYFINHTRPI